MYIHTHTHIYVCIYIFTHTRMSHKLKLVLGFLGLSHCAFSNHIPITYLLIPPQLAQLPTPLYS